MKALFRFVGKLLVIGLIILGILVVLAMCNEQNKNKGNWMTAEEASIAETVKQIRYSYPHYDSSKESIIFGFELFDKNRSNIKAPTLVDVIIISGDSEIYNKTFTVKADDYTNYKTSIEINRSELGDNCGKSVTVRCKVYNTGYFAFEEIIHSVELPDA